MAKKDFITMELFELIKSKPDYEKDVEEWDEWYEAMQKEIGSFLMHENSMTYEEKMNEVDERLRAIEKTIKKLKSHHHSDNKVLFEA